MAWQLSILLSNVFAALRAIEARKIGTLRRDLTLFSFILSFICVVAVGIFYVLFFGEESIDHQAAWHSRGLISLMAICIGLENLLTLRLFRLLPASIVILLSLLNPLSVVLIASIFLGESLTLVQWFGASLVLSGVFTVVLIKKASRSNKKKLAISTGLMIALFVAVVYGVALTLEKKLLDQIGMSTYVLYGWGAQLIASVVIASFYYKQFHLPRNTNEFTHALTYGLLLGFAGILYVATQVESNSASLTVISSSSKVAIGVVLSYFLLKEKEHVRIKLMGVLLSFIGMVVLFQ